MHNHPQYSTSNMSTISKSERITQLMNSRRGKKGSITKRIAQIDRIVGDGGSRSQVTYLTEALSKVQQALQAVCEDLLNVAPDTDSEWLDNENMRIDTCISEAKAYLERRRGDPPSTEQLTESWVHQFAAERDFASLPSEVAGEGEMKEVVDRFAGMGTNTSVHQRSEPSSDFLKPAHMHWTSGGQQGAMFIPSEQRFTTNVAQNNMYTQAQSNVNTHVGDNAMSRSYVPFHNNLPAAPTTSFAAGATATAAQHTPIVSSGLGRYNTYVPPQYASHRNNSFHQTNGHQNQVDSWIDELTVQNVEKAPRDHENRENDIAMGFFIQQSLPRMNVPDFDGSPSMWVEFITTFRDLVHDQPFLNVLRKSTLLLQHLSSQPKRSVQGFPNNATGYISALQRLKFLFGQRGKIAQATISKVTQGKDVPDFNEEALSELYFCVSDCLVTLTQLNYFSDVYSSETLRQVVSRLPRRMQCKWAEYSFGLRSRGQDSNLVHFESWLQTRVMALKEHVQEQSKKRGTDDDKTKTPKSPKFAGRTDMKTILCTICQGHHLFWKCEKYVKLADVEKFKLAKTQRLCYNCLRDGHQTKDCTSKISCSKKDCTDRHHSTLHDFFSKTNKENVDNNNNPVEEPAVDEPPAAPAAAAPQNQISMVTIRCHPNTPHLQ